MEEIRYVQIVHVARAAIVLADMVSNASNLCFLRSDTIGTFTLMMISTVRVSMRATLMSITEIP